MPRLLQEKRQNATLKEYITLSLTHTHTHTHTQVPRLLQEKRQNDKLKEYITKSNDKVLFRWMAQLCESQVPALLALLAQKYLLYQVLQADGAALREPVAKFTGFTSTNVQILALTRLAGARGAGARLLESLTYPDVS